MTIDVVGFGALNVDKLYLVNKIAREDDESYIKDLNKSCGGSAANTMIGLSRLGLNTAMIGKVAKDPEGYLLLENLKDEGVKINSVISSVEGRSGSVLGFVDPHGQRALYVDPGVNDSISPNEVKLDLFEQAKILHLTSFVGNSIKTQEALLDKLPSGIKVSFDPGRIYAERGLGYIENILKKTDLLLLNEGELKLLTEEKYKTFDEKIKCLKDFNIETIVVKCGDKGCYSTEGELTHYENAFHVKCVDTTGAGDAFNAGFLYGVLKGKNLQESCIAGNYVAACCIKERGAIKGLPDSIKTRD